MANTSVSQMHELAVTGEKVGFEPNDFAALSNNSKLMKRVLQVIRGEAEIIIKAVDKAAKVIIQKTTDLLSLIKQVAVPATAEKEISKSFPIGPRYYHRDADLNSWLSAKQRAGVAGKLKVYQLEKELTFKEIAQAILGVDEASISDLAKGLIAGNHTVVPSQIEALIESTEAGEETELRTDGWVNFFFVEDKDGGVCVVSVRRFDGQWVVYVHRLGHSDRWRVGRRFFSRN